MFFASPWGPGPAAGALAAFFVSARNAFDSRGHTRLFWGLMTGGHGHVVLQPELLGHGLKVSRASRFPILFGGTSFFSARCPHHGGVAIRPHQADDSEGHVARARSMC
jgi:hypothetical protein